MFAKCCAKWIRYAEYLKNLVKVINTFAPSQSSLFVKTYQHFWQGVCQTFLLRNGYLEIIIINFNLFAWYQIHGHTYLNFHAYRFVRVHINQTGTR